MRFKYLISNIMIGYILTFSINAMALTCEPGYYDELGTCKLCPIGTYSTGGENTYCKLCCNGTYAPEAGMSQCIDVPAGYYAVDRNTIAFYGEYELCIKIYSIKPGDYPVTLSSSRECPTGRCSFYRLEECYKGAYCPAATGAVDCPTGYTTAGTGAQSVSECNICMSGYEYKYYDEYDYSVCNECPAGTYKPDDGNAPCIACTNKPDNSHYATTRNTGNTRNNCAYTCDDGYYGATNTTSGTCTECGLGYWCSNGTRNTCGDGKTTTTQTATSSADCIDIPKQTTCEYGATKLHAGDLEYSMWNECDSPALWIGLADGNCCVNLSPGTQTNALNIQYNNITYHTTN